MSAYNWLEIDEKCPACGQTAGFRFQTHVASDHGGDATGAFFDNTYRIGQRMRWWPKSDSRFADWRSGGLKDTHLIPEDEDLECCEAECPRCHSEIFFVVRIRDFVFCGVCTSGLASHWPDAFYK